MASGSGTTLPAPPPISPPPVSPPPISPPRLAAETSQGSPNPFDVPLSSQPGAIPDSLTDSQIPEFTFAPSPLIVPIFDTPAANKGGSPGADSTTASSSTSAKEVAAPIKKKSKRVAVV